MSVSTLTQGRPDTHADRAALAIVTGATSGIGYCMAHALAKRGLRTLLIARSQEKLCALSQELSSQGRTSIPCVLDLADTHAIEPTLAPLLAQHGQVDILINNAGFGVYQPFMDTPPQTFDELMRVNFLAPITLARMVLPGMLQQNRGWVINITSMSARFGPWGHSGYAASKAALATWTQSLAIEHEKTAIHFCAVYPGLVDTPYFQKPSFQKLYHQLAKRMISPQTVAKQVMTLLDHPRIDLCIPRHYRLIDWLYAASPRLVQYLVSRESRIQ